MKVGDAIVHGAARRLRPILMTAMATIFALLPLGDRPHRPRRIHLAAARDHRDRRPRVVDAADAHRAAGAVLPGRGREGAADGSAGREGGRGEDRRRVAARGVAAVGGRPTASTRRAHEPGGGSNSLAAGAMTPATRPFPPPWGGVSPAARVRLPPRGQVPSLACRKSTIRVRSSGVSIAIEWRSPFTVTYSVSMPALRRAATRASDCCLGMRSSSDCPMKNGGSLPSTW